MVHPTGLHPCSQPGPSSQQSAGSQGPGSGCSGGSSRDRHGDSPVSSSCSSVSSGGGDGPAGRRGHAWSRAAGADSRHDRGPAPLDLRALAEEYEAISSAQPSPAASWGSPPHVTPAAVERQSELPGPGAGSSSPAAAAPPAGRAEPLPALRPAVGARARLLAHACGPAAALAAVRGAGGAEEGPWPVAGSGGGDTGREGDQQAAGEGEAPEGGIRVVKFVPMP
jgi:hypothetical protein